MGREAGRAIKGGDVASDGRRRRRRCPAPATLAEEEKWCCFKRDGHQMEEEISKAGQLHSSPRNCRSQCEPLNWTRDGSTENCNLQNRAIDLSQTKSRMCRKLHYLVHHEYSALPFLRWAFNGARHGSGFRRGSVSPPPPPPTSPLTPLRFSISIDRPRFIGQVYYIIGKKEERRDQRWTRA